jgi:hypothetical protein
MPNPLTALIHPLEAWRAFVQRADARADAAARAAGLTVEVLPGGVWRYRDPRLDRLAAHRTRGGAEHHADAVDQAQAGEWSLPSLTRAGWSR